MSRTSNEKDTAVAATFGITSDHAGHSRVMNDVPAPPSQSSPTHCGGAAAPSADVVPAYPALTIDFELYAHHLENSDLTEDQKQEFLATLWSIVVTFVDLGFGIHPVQLAAKDGRSENTSDLSAACGQNGENNDLGTIIAADVLNSDHTAQSDRQDADGPEIGFIGAKEES